MNLLVKFPTRGRPEQALRVLRCWIENCSGRHLVSFMVTIDADDTTMQSRNVRMELDLIPNVRVLSGIHRSKVEAYNSGLASERFDILVCASDDMIPVQKWWDDTIACDMDQFFPGLDGALHYFDGYTGGPDLITMNILGFQLFSSLGYAYHPSYRSFFCDNDFTAVVKRLRCWRYSSKHLFIHDHNGNRPDLTFVTNASCWDHDAAVFRQRSADRFGLRDGWVEGVSAMDPWSTHLPMLIRSVTLTESGPILELGCGEYSTPILHQLCDQRLVLSVDHDREYIERFRAYESVDHQFIVSCDSLDAEITNRFWDVVLVDHAPAHRRGLDIELLAHRAKLLVVHDTEDPTTYGYDRVFPMFKHPRAGRLRNGRLKIVRSSSSNCSARFAVGDKSM